MGGAPSSFEPINPWRTAWRWISPSWILGLIAGAGLASAIFYRLLQEPQPLGLSVHATQSTAQVRIAWDQRSRTVRKARAGYVEIVDGNQNVRVDLDANELHIGYVNYQCQSR